MTIPKPTLWRTRLPEERALRSAALSALLYMALATGYIVLSSHLAASLATSVEELATIESAKGIAFVAFTGILFFFFSFGWWCKTCRQRDLLIQSERRAAAALYSAALSHDLNNMLVILMGLVDELKGQEERDSRLARVRDSIQNSVQKLSSLSRHIASTAKQLHPTETVRLDLSAALVRIADLARKHPDLRSTTLAVIDIPPVILPLNGELLEQAMLNLILNAAQAAGPKGRVEVTGRHTGNAVAVEVHDNGPGVPPEKVDAIFNAGFTTKPSGSGLGLLSAQAFAASCHGRITVGRSPLGGALFQILIPREAKDGGGLPPTQ